MTALSFASPQDLFGTCSDAEADAFFKTLSNPDQCRLSLYEFFSPASITTPAELQPAVDEVCSVSCGKSISRFLFQVCSSGPTAVKLGFYCQSTDDSTRLNSCRYSVPDLLDLSLIDDLESCLQYNTDTPDTCPQGCNTTLDTFAKHVGCCYQTVYNGTGFLLAGYIASGFLSVSQAATLMAISEPNLWSACAIPLLTLCNISPFSDDSEPIAPIVSCNDEDVSAFVESELSPECNEAYKTVFASEDDTDSTEMITDDMIMDLYDTFCSPDCLGAVVRYEKDECSPSTATSLGTAKCHRMSTEGEMGDLCAFTVGKDMINSTLFTDVWSSCISPDPVASEDCPDTCSAALEELTAELGCCYQTIYNNTDFIDFFTLSGDITIEERAFFGRISQPGLWETCGVPLVAECTGDPFGDGADKFIASSVVLAVAVVASFISWYN